MTESDYSASSNASLDEEAIRSSIWDLINREQFGKALAASQHWSSKGSLHARIFLAWLHEHGKGVLPDPAAAYELYKAVASMGVPEAQFCLGRLCLRIGRSEEAIEWLDRASMRNYPPAAFRLFVIFSQGKIVPADLKKS